MIRKVLEMYIPNPLEISFTGLLSIIIAGVSEFFYQETVHGFAVVVTAVIAAIVVHLVNYYMQKWFPIDKNKKGPDPLT